MLSDLSNFESALHDPVTPTEKQLKQNVLRQRSVVDTVVYKQLVGYGFSPETSRAFLSSHIDKMLNSYFEDNFPLSTPELGPFLKHVERYVGLRAEHEKRLQTVYDSNRYVRTMDPRGKFSLPYPEVL